ncbi:MAG: dTMP kinase [bacterium]
MISVALIGADGAGKTSIANRLRETFPRPIKYIYMGINIESSNVALPTSRLIEFVRKLKQRKNGSDAPESTSLHHRPASGKKRGLLKSIWLFVRLLNRLAEEWYRQLLSWIYRKRGYLVLYDRHFLFDFEENGLNGKKLDLPLAERIHRWCLHKFYPEPDLVLFLDAPAEVLYARKKEASLEYLSARRAAFLAQGEKTRNFCTIDATRPIEVVYTEVRQKIEGLYQTGRMDDSTG